MIKQKSLYLTVRNILFFMALILSLLVVILVSFENHTNNNEIEENQLKYKMTKLEFSQAVSNSIIQKLNTDNVTEYINHQQLQYIVENVMKNIKNSSNQIIYTQK